MNLAEARDAWESGAWVEFTDRGGRVVGVLRGWESSVAAYGVALVVAPLGGGPQQVCPAELVERWAPRPGDWVREPGALPAIVVEWLPKAGLKGAALVESGNLRFRVPVGNIAPCAPVQPSTGTGSSLIGGGSSEAEVARVEAEITHVAALGMTPQEWHVANGGSACTSATGTSAAVPETPAAEHERAFVGTAMHSAERGDVVTINLGPGWGSVGGAVKAIRAAVEVGAFGPPPLTPANTVDASPKFDEPVRWVAYGPPAAVIPREPPRTHNTTCPRCGKRAYQGIGDVQCVEPVCDDPETRMPDSVRRQPERVRPRDGSPPPPYERPRYEHVFVAWGRDVSAKHPTRDGAIQAWREAVAAKGGAA